MSHARLNHSNCPQYPALYSERFVRLISALAAGLDPHDCSIAIEAATALHRRILPESLMCVAAAAVGIAASVDSVTDELDPDEKRLAQEAAAWLQTPERTPAVLSRQLADCVAAICTVRLRSFVERNIQGGGSSFVSGVADFTVPFCMMRKPLVTSHLFEQFDHQLRQALDILGIEPDWLATERTAFRLTATAEKGIKDLKVVESLMNAAGLFVCRPKETSDLYVSAFREKEAWLSRVMTALAARLNDVEVTLVDYDALPAGEQWRRRNLVIDQKLDIYRRQAMLQCQQVDPVPMLLKIARLKL